MKLFTKEIDKKLFQQYKYGSNLSEQKVVAKIFNPYGKGIWYLLNSDPNDPDYIWAIVDLFAVEMGSVSRSKIENMKVPPFRLPLERDLYFEEVNALELWEKLTSENYMAKGGEMKHPEYVEEVIVVDEFKDGGAVDREGNSIGNGTFHADYNVYEFEEYPQITNSVSKSETTESVYVTYYNKDNDKEAIVRFSNHVNNATIFGDQLNGNFTGKDEILYKLGLMKRVFIPRKFIYIPNRAVKYKDVDQYPKADLTIKEMYALGAGADLSKYNGKIAKDSNYLILGDKVEEHTEKRKNAFGSMVEIGNYIYEPLDKFAKGGETKNWIQDAIKHKGALRKQAKKEGLIHGDEKLSMADLKKLEKEGGKTAKRAHLAETLKKIRERNAKK